MPDRNGKTQCDVSATVQLLVSNIEEVYEKLKAKGVEFSKELHEEIWGGKQATFKDPDGHILEITQIYWKKYFEVSPKGAQETRSLS